MEDNNTEPDETIKPITICLMDTSNNNEETYFKVKLNTKLNKIFNAFAERKGVSLTGMRFLFNGERLKEGDTPEMVGMKDKDQIDVILHQTGG